MPGGTDVDTDVSAQPETPDPSDQAASARESAQPDPWPVRYGVSMDDQPSIPSALNRPAAVQGPGGPLVPEQTPVSHENLPANFSDPTLNQQDQSLKQQSFGSKIYHGVLNALAGTQEVRMTGIDEKGNPIYSKADMGPGTQWKKIISGAITGLAAGSQVKGPGGAMRAFGAGEQATEEKLHQEQLEQRQEAQQTFENQQKAKLNDANVSMLTTNVARMTYDLGRAKVAASVEDTDRMNKFMGMINDGGDGTRYLNHFASFEDARAAFRDDPTLHDAHAEGQLVAIPHITDGKVDGVDAAYITKDWANRKIDHAISFTVPRYQNGKVEQISFTVPKGSKTNGEMMQLMMGQAADSMKEHREDLKTESEVKLQGAETAKTGAETKKTQSETEMSDYELQVLKETGFLPGKRSEGAASKEEDEAEWGPGGYKQGFKPWEKQMVQPAQQVERGFELAKQAYADYQLAASQGKRLPTGAKSMLMLAQHIQNTFGTGKGTRQTQHMIEQHLGARSVSDNMTVAFNKFINGDELSKDQWKDFYELISQSRDAAWEQVIKSGDAIGRPLEKAAIPADMIAKYAKKPEAPPTAAGAGGGGGTQPGGGTAAQPGAGGGIKPGAADALPPAALQQVKLAMGKPVPFKNGQVWQMNQAGQAIRIK